MGRGLPTLNELQKAHHGRLFVFLTELQARRFENYRSFKL